MCQPNHRPGVPSAAFFRLRPQALPVHPSSLPDGALDAAQMLPMRVRLAGLALGRRVAVPDMWSSVVCSMLARPEHRPRVNAPVAAEEEQEPAPWMCNPPASSASSVSAAQPASRKFRDSTRNLRRASRHPKRRNGLSEAPLEGSRTERCLGIPATRRAVRSAACSRTTPAMDPSSAQ